MMKFLRISSLCVKSHLCRSLARCMSTHIQTKSLVQLNQRTVIRLTGEDVTDFLQGLITNDMRHLTEGATSIYSVFLNIKGRVLYDTIIYRAQEDGIFYVECDSSITNNILKHMKMYKLRKKIDIKSMEDEKKLWVVYDNRIVTESSNEDSESKSNIVGKIFPCGAIDNKSSKTVDNISIYIDPRVSDLGLRILTESNVTESDIMKHLDSPVKRETDNEYKAFRYKLGIGEGVGDLGFGVSFPLETNCDYLHGVSFHKGCYIGQELTARTHHTGVVRKRLMPLILDSACSKSIEFDDKIINEDEKVVGKIRGMQGKFGLGLVRITEALASKNLTVKDCGLKVIRPKWWPQESQKVENVLKSSKN